MTRWPAAMLALALSAPASFAQVDGPPGGPELESPTPEARTFFQGWKGSIELGLNGATGNSENFNIRAGLRGERDVDLEATKASLVYLRASEGSDLTQNRLQADLRHDWIFREHPRWRYFVNGTYEYDDFQDWNHRLTLGNGLGYSLIEDDRTLVVARAGLGVVREFGGSDNRWRPEGIFGLDFSHKISDRQKISGTFEYLPELLELGPYRLRNAVAWEVVVDPESSLSLRVGAEQRYDSSPGEGRKRSDVNYFALLSMSF